MIFAAVDDTGYNIVLLLHIVSAMAAFAPAFVHPLLTKQSKDMEITARGTIRYAGGDFYEGEIGSSFVEDERRIAAGRPLKARPARLPPGHLPGQPPATNI